MALNWIGCGAGSSATDGMQASCALPTDLTLVADAAKNFVVIVQDDKVCKNTVEP